MNRINKIRFSNAILKHIALATMLVDHIGTAFFPTNLVFRIIGRSSFIIFCFLLAEGAVHTRSRVRYFLRLLTFALVSFVPYSLFGFNVWFCTWQLNIFFVLSSAVAMIALFDCAKKVRYRVPLYILILAAFSCLGISLHFDYDFIGFVLVAIFYLLRSKKLLQIIAFFLATLCLIPLYYHFYDGQNWFISIAAGVIESCGFVALFFVLNSSGERGSQLPKWFYYSFYPLHLLIIWIIKTYII